MEKAKGLVKEEFPNLPESITYLEVVYKKLEKGMKDRGYEVIE